jgi:hypothetical protein
MVPLVKGGSGEHAHWRHGVQLAVAIEPQTSQRGPRAMPTKDAAQLQAVDIAVSPEDSDLIPATTEQGVARSTDGGATWKETATVPDGQPLETRTQRARDRLPRTTHPLTNHKPGILTQRLDKPLVHQNRNGQPNYGQRPQRPRKPDRPRARPTTPGRHRASSGRDHLQGGRSSSPKRYGTSRGTQPSDRLSRPSLRCAAAPGPTTRWDRGPRRSVQRARRHGRRRSLAAARTPATDHTMRCRTRPSN